MGWDQLDDAQRDAIRFLADHLADAVDQVNQRSEKRYEDSQIAPDLDPTRSNRAVFLSGGRGFGKTTILLTLQDLTSSTVGRQSPQDVEATDLRSRIATLRERVVWLETLDLETLPGPTNLLAAILQRVKDKAEAVMEDTKSGGPPDRNLEAGYWASPLGELERLQRDVGLAWEGNLPERQAEVDPDTFAMEQIRAEQARLSFTPSFSKALDGLAADVHWGPHKRDPVFVMPVDDFDLNPARAVDLLRLVRMLSAPRFFTILLGDLADAEKVLRLKQQGEFLNLLQVNDIPYPQGQPSIEVTREGASEAIEQQPHEQIDQDPYEQADREPQEIRDLAQKVTSSAIRKVLPPSQRFELEAMTIEEARKYSPPGEEEDLESLLDEIPVPSGTLLSETLPDGVDEPSPGREEESRKPRSLAQGWELELESLKDLLFPPPPGDEWGEGTPGRWFPGSGIVSGPPRVVADLWHRMDRLRADFDPEVDDHGFQQLFDELEDEAERLIEEFSELGPHDRSFLADQFYHVHYPDFYFGTEDLDSGRFTNSFPFEALDSFTCNPGDEAVQLADQIELIEGLETDTAGKLKEGGFQSARDIDSAGPDEIEERTELDEEGATDVHGRIAGKLPDLPPADPAEGEDLEFEFFVKTGIGFNRTAEDSPIVATPKDAPLASYFPLLHDLAQMDSHGIVQHDVLKVHTRRTAALTTWNGASLPWPRSTVHTFFEVGLGDALWEPWYSFLLNWPRGRQSAPSPSESDFGQRDARTILETAAFGWIVSQSGALGAAIPKRWLAEPTIPDSEDWAELASSLRQLSPPDAVGSSVRWEGWIARIAVLLSPELGLPKSQSFPKMFVEEFSDVWNKEHTSDFIKRQRSAHLANIWFTNRAELVTRILKMQHPMNDEPWLPDKEEVRSMLGEMRAESGPGDSGGPDASAMHAKQ